MPYSLGLYSSSGRSRFYFPGQPGTVSFFMPTKSHVLSPWSLHVHVPTTSRGIWHKRRGADARTMRRNAKNIGEPRFFRVHQSLGHTSPRSPFYQHTPRPSGSNCYSVKETAGRPDATSSSNSLLLPLWRCVYVADVPRSRLRWCAVMVLTGDEVRYNNARAPVGRGPRRISIKAKGERDGNAFRVLNGRTMGSRRQRFRRMGNNVPGDRLEWIVVFYFFGPFSSSPENDRASDDVFAWNPSIRKTRRFLTVSIYKRRICSATFYNRPILHRTGTLSLRVLWRVACRQRISGLRVFTVDGCRTENGRNRYP